MNRLLISIWTIAIVPSSLVGCTVRENTETQATNAKTGTLALVANGEDFIRQGFVSKDGWQINFDHAYVSLDRVNAYSSDPPFNPSGETQLKPTQTVSLVDKITTVDLAEGEEDAEPILVTQTDAPVGTYNALSWKLVPAQEGSTQGNSIVLKGTASKDGREINFTIGFDRELEYTCGEYVGENRKGIVLAANMAQVETTFHFDHIFGDNSLPAEDALNQEAIGFEPFASLAQNGQLKVNQSDLAKKLNSEEYAKLQQAITGLGHVGEGHCRSSSNIER
ncbi:MAG: DUF4382 domain-containing protein [Xenococcaceae cyanobacterium MO_188.B32]|nr:DUF4382 domain-containing protein [Xenococcaceae cyanobacterium MO_188.B32]